MTVRRVSTQEPSSTGAEDQGSSFASNEIRLSPRGWLVVLILVAAVFHFIPAAWERLEPLDSEGDYRVPFRLSRDYWTVRRYCRDIAAGDKTIVLGDSVIWGHYVGRQQTLPHFLNQLAGRDQFINLGVDGIHPAAMQGLVQHYCQDIADKKLIVHCNLLWISSERHDLSTEKESTFNHPALVPQFYPRIPCYSESLSRRLGIAVGRQVPFFGWVDHLQIAYFQDMDFASWTIEHPRANPLDAVTLELPSPDEPPSPKPVAESWTAKGLRQFNPDWVELDASLQWRCFRNTIAILRQRRNAVFVLVGPFNEHMLTAESLATYANRKRDVATWLRQQGIPHYVPDALPSDSYADASHPLAEGYQQLAERLLEDSASDAQFFAQAPSESQEQ